MDVVSSWLERLERSYSTSVLRWPRLGISRPLDILLAPSLTYLTPPFLTLLLTEGHGGEILESGEWYVVLS